MPIHDWTRAPSGYFHHFHQNWTVGICTALNAGVLPADKRLTLASYAAGTFKTAYVEPVAAGDTLPAMPLFLDAKKYIRVPLGETYESTWKACPEEFKQRVV